MNNDPDWNRLMEAIKGCVKRGYRVREIAEDLERWV